MIIGYVWVATLVFLPIVLAGYAFSKIAEYSEKLKRFETEKTWEIASDAAERIERRLVRHRKRRRHDTGQPKSASTQR